MQGAVSAQARTERNFVNPTPIGSATLATTLWLPPLSFPGARPVVVFLHGHGFAGRDYDAFAARLAAAGYVVAAPNTALVDGWLQGLDAAAMHEALRLDALDATSPLFGRCDVARAGLVGHSMGAANVLRVLAQTSVYRVGIALTPLITPLEYPPQVATPVLFVACEGDTLTPWRSNLLPVRDRLAASWMSTIWDASGNHLNPVFRDFAGSMAKDARVFDATQTVCQGALRRYLTEDASGLDFVVGEAARAESLALLVEHRFLQPEHFATVDATSYALHVAGPDGPVLELGSFGRASIPTPFGELGLDPNYILIAPGMVVQSGRVTSLVFPRGPQFAKVSVWFQSLSFDTASSLRFGRVLMGELGT